MHKLLGYRWIAGLLGLMLVACNIDTNTDTGGTQLFEGFYASGPEMSSFVTCAMGELPGPDKGYWLIPNNEFSQLYENPEGITFGEIAGTYGPGDEFAIYVRFKGILSAELDKEYGYSGLYLGEIQVTKALEASRRWVGTKDQLRVSVGCGQ